jgi:hypothetical protein
MSAAGTSRRLGAARRRARASRLRLAELALGVDPVVALGADAVLRVDILVRPVGILTFRAFLRAERVVVLPLRRVPPALDPIRELDQATIALDGPPVTPRGRDGRGGERRACKFLALACNTSARLD